MYVQRCDRDEDYDPHDDKDAVYRRGGEVRDNMSNDRKEQKILKKPTPDEPGLTAKHHLRHFVRHNYHDHSNDDEVFMQNASCHSNSCRGGVITPFPLVLYAMLDAAVEQGFSGIISWLTHGRAFVVHDNKGFVEKVMPMFFRQSKISSFQRQLNLYGFCRLTGRGPDQGAYYNEYFLRGRPDLTSKLHRTRIKGTGVRTSSNPTDEPNFYKMEPMKQADQTHQDLIFLRLFTPNLKINLLEGDSDIEQFMELEPFSHGKLLDIVEYNNEELDSSTELLDHPSYQLLPTPMDLGEVEDVKEIALFLSEVDLVADEMTQFYSKQVEDVEIGDITAV